MSVRDSFSLIEVVMALGIVSFALVAIISLFFVGFTTNKQSSDQIQAANLASLLVATRRAVPTNAIANFALPPLNRTYSTNGTYLTNGAGVSLDGTTSGTRSFNLYYQAGTNAATGPRVAQVYLLLWSPPSAPVPTNGPGARYELSTQVLLP